MGFHPPKKEEFLRQTWPTYQGAHGIASQSSQPDADIVVQDSACARHFRAIPTEIGIGAECYDCLVGGVGG
jgi:hypothetical protein